MHMLPIARYLPKWIVHERCVIRGVLSAVERNLHVVTSVEPQVRPAFDTVECGVVGSGNHILMVEHAAVISAAHVASAPNSDEAIASHVHPVVQATAEWVHDLALNPRAKLSHCARDTQVTNGRVQVV